MSKVVPRTGKFFVSPLPLTWYLGLNFILLLHFNDVIFSLIITNTASGGVMIKCTPIIERDHNNTNQTPDNNSSSASTKITPPSDASSLLDSAPKETATSTLLSPAGAMLIQK